MPTANEAKAVIYVRVSSERQKNEGHGLDSQEYRCREYARQNGYVVEKVFPDTFSGGGDFLNRPAMKELLAYIDSKPHVQFVVIFDDLKRFARDTVFHWSLRHTLKLRNAIPKCLNYNFDDSPEGTFVETIFAAQNQLEREQNRRQVIQKQKARFEKGYWPLHHFPGYRSKKDPMHGKLLVPYEPEASIIKESLEGFASGRFQEQKDVQKFLQERCFRKRVHLEQVKRLLKRAYLCAGFIEYEPWEVTRRKGHHKPLISYETALKVYERLSGKIRIRTREDYSDDFPLRGFIQCSECLHEMTASWSRGRNKKYGYYHCEQKDCKLYGKSIKKELIEEDFKILLKIIEPKEGILNLTKALLIEAWEKRIKSHSLFQQEQKNKLKKLNEEKQRLLTHITKTQSDEIIKTYENKIEEIIREEEILKNQINNKVQKDFGTALETVCGFIKSPYCIWTSNEPTDKRLVLKLVFAENLPFHKENGFGTAKLTPALRLFSLYELDDSRLVEMRGKRLNQLKTNLKKFWEFYQNSSKLQSILKNQDSSYFI